MLPTNFDYQPKNSKNKVMEAEKPVKLIEHIIKLLTKEGQIVLDTFAGSGSHGVASLRCNRRFIGIEYRKKILRDLPNKD